MKIFYERKLSRIWRALEGKMPGARFSENMVAGLPEPAQRYLLHAIAPGTPLASSVELRMEGKFRLKSEADWFNLQAEQILSPPKGFVWKARAGKGSIRFSGADFYFNKSAGLHFWLWGVIPVAKEKAYRPICRSWTATFTSVSR